MQRTTVREVQADIGWLAGIIDGEASITFVKNGQGRLTHMIHIIGSDPQLLEKCARIINTYNDGGTEVKILDKKYKTGIFKTNKKMFRIEIWRQGHLKKLLPLLIPHLTEKKLRCQKMLNFLIKHKKGTWFKDGEVEEYLAYMPAETK